METSDIFTLTILSLLVTSATILLALFMFRRGWVLPSGQEIDPAPPLSVGTRLSIELMFVVVVVVAAFGILINNSDLLAGGGSSVPDLLYQIQIQDEKTGRPIKDAQILLEIDGRAFAKEITDSEGLSVLLVDPSLSGEQARLIVKSEAYNISSQEVTLIEKGVPSLILLQPNK